MVANDIAIRKGPLLGHQHRPSAKTSVEALRSATVCKYGNPISLGALCVGRSGGFHVKKVEEYLEHASECRTLARSAPPEHRQQLEDMAITWEQLAHARKRRQLKKPLELK